MAIISVNLTTNESSEAGFKQGQYEIKIVPDLMKDWTR